ncbi:HNH endonuclease [Erysipelotrichaceae bacterium RD49]|nr:HNH endonuclease [Erysipelotrichaceae bacterium RD49]
MVYVLDVDGKPLMPTQRHGKVRHLLNDKKAKVVKKNPFTIKLLYDSTRYTQPVTLGVDAGSKQIGLSASSEDKELLAWDVQNRTDITELISTRREARRARRNRKTRYRAPRFNNRVRTKHKGWLAPSVEHKIDTHLHCIEEVQKLLPVTRIVVETASFDTQKLKNPEISGTEYQNGDQKGFWNVREYVLFRDNHEYQHCHGKKKDPILNIHHIESRKTGGNSPSNLITLCETCHNEYHKKIKSEKIKGPEDFNLPKRTKPYRDAAFMGIMRWTLLERLKEANPDIEVINTYGYLTKNKRIELNLAKVHYNDAYCIAGNLNAKPLKQCLYLKKIRRHNRQIHKFNFIKGHKRKNNQAPHMVGGFCLFDKVRYKGQECFITGRRQCGAFTLKTFWGQKIKDGASMKKLILVERTSGYMKETATRQFLATQTV